MYAVHIRAAFFGCYVKVGTNCCVFIVLSLTKQNVGNIKFVHRSIRPIETLRNAGDKIQRRCGFSHIRITSKQSQCA